MEDLTAMQRRRLIAKAAAVKDFYGGRKLSHAAALHGISVATLRRAIKDTKEVEPGQWLAALVPDYAKCGRQPAVPIDPQVWRVFCADYLRLEQPSAASCHGRLATWCHKHEKPLPPIHQLLRRLQKLPRPQVVAAREGREVLDQMYPAQQRTVAGLRPLERVNGDGWPIDVFVETPDGRIVRPVLWVWQDVLSRAAVSWRIAETESADLVLSSFRDLCMKHGVPEHLHIDNTRAVSSMWLTAGVSGRKRFGSTDEFAGAFKSLGVDVHFTQLVATDARTASGRLRNRGRGQSKPVERFFRTLSDELARHPACAGSYVGNSTSNKPANYNSGTKGIPWEQMVKLADAVIIRLNARGGRQTETGQGKYSAGEVFATALKHHPARQAEPVELDALLAPAETVKVGRDATVRLRSGAAPEFGSNRYWSDELYSHRGKKLFARYDPTDLHGEIRLYDHVGRFVCEASCLVAGGFGSAAAAAKHNRARREFVRHFRKSEQARARADQHLVDELVRIETGQERATSAPKDDKVVKLRSRRNKDDAKTSAAADKINRGWKIMQGGAE